MTTPPTLPGRKTAYRASQLARGATPCVRCGKPAVTQVSVGALGGRWLAVCAADDAAMNAWVLGFLKVPGAAALADAYARGA